VKPNRLRTALKKGQRVVGPFIMIPAPELVEIAGHAGFDFVVIDMEHGPITYESAANLCRAADAVDITPVIRVQVNDQKFILRALEVGAKGLLIPWVNTRQEAEQVVWAAKCYPEGMRGWAPITRGYDYGKVGTERADFLQYVNEHIAILLQIETREGVENREEICAVEGVDLIFLGPGDLSQSLGVPGQFTSPVVEDAMLQVIECAHRHGKAAGVFTGTDLAWAQKWVNAGVELIAPFADVYKVFADWTWEAKAFRLRQQ
jgi:4-hydroxy-2-oxoheptanedioate aldolase